MLISEMNWMQAEAHLARDDRAVVPLGSTEQHAYLSLSVDSILASKMAEEAAAPSEALVWPVLPYGITPYFAAYPGTVTLGMETYGRILADILSSLHRAGARRIVFVNGHGGNNPGQTAAMEWLAGHPDTQVRWHNWWAAPATMGTVKNIDPLASHASWMENFPWTRLPGVEMPAVQKPMVDIDALKSRDPVSARILLGDGNYGGFYQRSDAEMAQVWAAGVAETRQVIEDWA
ncbi:creatininase family protein [Poseidonocella sp. HB161398]|uniref:creatininase family protein n=1 Tax=Poseidonocella sp. HB161398 TaxID=2320855 RepID=UPI001107FA4B|nr:creatininase family protein [Poseidonocella sp. HB161398]